MKTFLTFTAAVVLSAGSVWAGAPCHCGGTATITTAPTPAAAPAMAANSGDRRTFSYEPGSAVAAPMAVSGTRVINRSYHSAAPSYTLQKSMRPGFVGR